jgi:glycosyltransferase involved in cell wall biosynthesis
MSVSTCADDRRGRPFAFLVSTTRWAGDLRKNLGSADYSYGFVRNAFAPLLSGLGSWTPVDRPETSLASAARRAEARGERPVHVAFHPPPNAYLTPGVPTILVPAWEFPQLPDRDLGLDTRSNWARVCRRADLLLTHTEFSAAAFRRAGLPCPVEVVPVPIPAADFATPDFDPDFALTLHCRHLSWGGPPVPVPAIVTPPAAAPAPAPAARLPLKARGKRAVKGVYWGTVGRVTSDRVNAALRRRLVGDAPPAGPPPPPAGPVTLRGLTYTTVLNLGDARKNVEDILTAFLFAFRDRPDATLVIKLVTNPLLEGAETARLRGYYHALGIRHACRVVVLSEYLTAEQMRDLSRATTYYVNASRAEGTCLPLAGALAAGRPALAPGNTGMADYMDDALGFVVRSHPEPACWPQDPERRMTTTWHRIVWDSLRARFVESARVFDADRDRYDALAAAARRRMADYAGEATITAALRRVLTLLPDRDAGAFDWPLQTPAPAPAARPRREATPRAA